MPYTMKTDGMVEVSKMLTALEDSAHGIAAKALYEGAGIMADEIQRSAKHIRTAPFKYARQGTRLPSPEEKAIVESAGVGIAKFEGGGTEINTSVGYRNAGYADLNGTTKPIPVIVNAINSGTSFMQKQPFVRQAKNSGSPKAIKAMEESIEKAFDALTK